MSAIIFSDYIKDIVEAKQLEITPNAFYTHWTIPLNKHILPYFGDMPLTDIVYTKVKKYFIMKAAEGMHLSTLEAHYNVLNTVFSSAIDDGIITINPSRNKKRFKLGAKSRKKEIYTEEEVKLILDYCNTHRDGIGIFLMLKLGLSRAEVLGLKWEDIRLKDQVIFINKNLIEMQGDYDGDRITTKDTKNEYRNRKILIDEETACFIAKHHQATFGKDAPHYGRHGVRVAPEFVVCNRYGEAQSPSNWYRRHYKVFMNDMHEYYLHKGIDIPILGSHNLRHTRASLWVNEGEYLPFIAMQMGWADYEMLCKVYAHPDIKTMKKNLDNDPREDKNAPKDHTNYGPNYAPWYKQMGKNKNKGETSANA